MVFHFLPNSCVSKNSLWIKTSVKKQHQVFNHFVSLVPTPPRFPATSGHKGSGIDVWNIHPVGENGFNV